MKPRLRPAGPRLASVAELESPSFQAFMAELNAFAATNGLREFRDWSKVWEYPWLWHHGLKELDWQGTHLVDLGSEISPFPWWVASRFGTRVTLIETDRQWIPKWEALKTALEVDVSWHIVDSERIPVPDHSVDLLTSFSVIEHQPDKHAAVAEAARVLKPGGVLALSFDICEPELGMSFPAWNGRALTMREYEEILGSHPSFHPPAPPAWNLEDVEAFKAWHLRSGTHHNYVVAAALHVRAPDPATARVLFVRPDTFGDLILFEPVVRALQQIRPRATIGLLVRSGYETLAPLFPEGVEWLVTTCQPYRDPFPAAGAPCLEELRALVSEFDPDLVVAPCQNATWLECAVALLTPSAEHVALGRRTLDPEVLRSLGSSGLPHAPKDLQQLEALFPRCLEVPSDLPETEKNRRFAAFLFGVELAGQPPRLTVPDQLQGRAAQLLAHFGLSAGAFLACCPAGTANVAIKTWPVAAFGEIVAWAEREHQLPTLLLGSAAERVRLEEVQASARRLGAQRVSVWLGEAGDFPQMIALLGQARAYLGNDTGALHAAAALGRPVVAIFGGGHWPSFRPVSDAPTLTVVQPLPCFGCGWNCLFGDAPCVQTIPVSAVSEALGELLSLPAGQPRNALVEVPANSALAARFGAASAALRTAREESAQRLQVLLAQGARMEELGSKLAAESHLHATEIARLHERLSEAEADRQRRLRVIEEQAQQLVAQEQRERASQAAHQAVSADLHQRLQACESDRGARLAALQALEKRLQESEADRGARLAAMENLETRLRECEADRKARLEAIQRLEARLAESEADRAARLEVIQRISAQLAESEADRAARLEVIQRITAQLAESEADRAARLEVIQRVSAQLAESEADRAARLEVIQRVSAQLAESEADRAARLEVIQRVSAQLAESEADRAARLEVIQRLTADLAQQESDRAAHLERIHGLESRLARTDTELASLRSYLEALQGTRAFRLLRGLKLVQPPDAQN